MKYLIKYSQVDNVRCHGLFYFIPVMFAKICKIFVDKRLVARAKVMSLIRFFLVLFDSQTRALVTLDSVRAEAWGFKVGTCWAFSKAFGFSPKLPFKMLHSLRGSIWAIPCAAEHCLASTSFRQGPPYIRPPCSVKTVTKF